LPQVAAYASHQVLVSKEVRKGITFATARTLSETERPEEIARLLSGSLAVESGVEHARNMLKTRRKTRTSRR
jgi:DNA repair protein RecN (Recombination protein N)